MIKDLNEPMIFGIDFIAKNELNYCASSCVFKWKGQSECEKGYAKVQSVQTLLPLQASVCKVQVRTKSGAKPSSKDTLVVNVSHPDNPLLTGGPYLVSPDENGLVTVPIHNCSPLSVEIDRNEFIGVVENASTREIREINPRYLSAVAAEKEKKRQKEQLSEEKKKFIFENVNLTVPDEYKSDYLAVILKNHECISRHNLDLGRTETLLHAFARDLTQVRRASVCEAVPYT